MKPRPLISAFAKIERAATHINELDAKIAEFYSTNPYQVVAEPDPDGTQEVWKFKITQRLPYKLHAIVGDVLHNLRPPLDQVLSAIALKFGRTEDHVEFPFRKTFEEFEVALAKQKKLPPDAKALIAAVQPYAGGNDLLFAMHYLNSRDKHRSNLIPINLVGQTSASRICFWRGLPLVIGCKKGQHLVMEAPFNEADLAETGKPLALYDCRPGRVLFGRAEDGGDESLQFMITTPGAKFEADFSPSLNVGFHGVGLDGQPVVAVLNDMRSLVEHLLLSFEAQFFS